jgi:hypothetical protein
MTEDAGKSNMKERLRRLLKPLAGNDGFVLPVVIFALLIMSTVVVASFLTADDEQRSSRAVRESSVALYAAEAGFNEVWGQWDDSLVTGLQPGQVRTIDSRQLTGGASYTVTVQRTDNDTTDEQRLFILASEGEMVGGGSRMLEYTILAEPVGGYHLGLCCNAVATVRGDIDVYPENNGSANELTGVNENPSGWGAACDSSYSDKPAVIMEDTTLLRVGSGHTLEGEVVETSLPDETFNEFGDYSWDDIKNMADHIVDATEFPNDHWENDGLIGPKYNADGSCDTSDPLNWGSDNPADPCFNYFPVILIRGEVDIHNAYGQAAIILDYDESRHLGAEFDIENGADFNGVILGRGCIEIEDGAHFHGSIFVDGTWDYDTGSSGCGADRDFDVNDGADAHYSQCAVDRALSESKLAMAAEAEEGTGAYVLRRSFTQVLR